MKEISIEEALEQGVYTKFTERGNGEFVYRLIGKDNSVYIRCEVKEACFGNAHYHKFCHESFLIQNGTLYLFLLVDGQLEVKKLQAGEQYIVEPEIPHTTFMCEGTVLHAIKFGECYENDWYGVEELNVLAREWERNK